MEKYIHIHAKSTRFEIFEQVKESKAVARLKKIRKMQEYYLGFGYDKLVVNTKLINPTLF